MDQDKNLMVENLLNITLEIIYLLTGEDYTVVKRTSADLPHSSVRWTRPWSPIRMTSPRSLILARDSEQKILELTDRIIELLTGEVPAVHYLEDPKDLDEDDTKNHEPLSSPANAHNIRTSSPDWKVEDNNDFENSPEESCSFQNRHSGLQDVDINIRISNDGEKIPDKSTFPPPRWDNIFTCWECGKCFTEHDALLMHQRAHAEEKSYQCSNCGKCFKKKSNLIQHLKIHSGEKPFLCTECGKSFMRKADLVKHQRIHTGEKPFPCPECGRCFTQISTLIRHRRFHSDGYNIRNNPEDQPVLSLDCKMEDDPGESSNFANIHPVLQDANTNSDPSYCKDRSTDQCDTAVCSEAPEREKIFPSLECDQFTQDSELLAHHRNHTGGKPFSCSYCGKSFTAKSNLIQHERIHSDEKRFICSVCGRGFTRKADLIKHLRIHTGEKPFHCIECGKCFTQNSALLRHKRCSHGDKTLCTFRMWNMLYT